LPVIHDINLPKSMKFGSAAPSPLEFGLDKKIYAAGKRTLRPSRPSGHCFDEPVILRQPVHDETRLRELGKANDGPPGMFHMSGASFEDLRCSIFN
jgi:hypothetical protein